MNFGFSAFGLLLGAVLFAPSLIFMITLPKNTPLEGHDAGPLFTLLERAGQAACLALLVTSAADGASAWQNIWFKLTVICIGGYYGSWIRYYAHGRNFQWLGRPLAFFPIPLAVFPVAAFAFSALWLRSVWMGTAVILLAVGHFANSWSNYQHSR